MNLKEQIREVLRKEYPNEPNWKGFTRWWLNAYGYDYDVHPNQVKFVDGKSDGGIDAVALPLEDQSSDAYFIIQSKYYSQPLKRSDLSRFLEAIHALQGPLDEFYRWLETCRDDLHSQYRLLRRHHDRCRFYVVAPCTIPLVLERALNRRGVVICDTRRLQTMFKSYKSGKTPRLSSLTLKVERRPVLLAQADGVKMHMFTARIGEFAEAFEKHDQLLFSGNIRYALKGATPKRVRDGIKETIESSPDQFVYSHNGITIACGGLRYQNKKLTMNSPSIVNGAQTVSYLGKIYPLAVKSKACVPVKLIEVNDHDALGDIESRVAYRSNNQNKVDASDLMTDLHSLVSLQRAFKQNHLFLERKKGEARPFMCQDRIPKEWLIQVLAACESVRGAVGAKRKQDLFRHHAERLFNKFDGNVTMQMEALLWAHTDSILDWVISNISNKKRRSRAQHARFAALTTIHRIVRSLGLKPKLLKRVKEWDQFPAVESFIYGSLKIILSKLLQYSAKDKKTETAFYKAISSVKPAVDFSFRRAKKTVLNLAKQI